MVREPMCRTMQGSHAFHVHRRVVILRQLALFFAGSGVVALQDQAAASLSFKSPLPLFRPAIDRHRRRVRTRALADGRSTSNCASTDIPGQVYPVNPRIGEVWGTKCYPDLASLPEPPAHAFVIVPAPAVQGVLETGVAAGLKSATVYAAQLGEGSDPEIVARGVALKAPDRALRAGHVRSQLHGLQRAARKELRLSQRRSLRADARLGRLRHAVRRHRAVHRQHGRASRRQLQLPGLERQRAERRPRRLRQFLRRGREHARHRAVRRGHPPSAGVHGGGGEGAGRRQADRRDQDRQVAEGARQRAVAHRRHRRRLRRLHRDVRALRHRRLPVARRHDRDAAGVPGRPAAEGAARRLGHDLGRHRRSPVRPSGGNRRTRDAGIRRRHQGDAASAGLVRARIEEPARRRQSRQRRA